MEKEFSALEHAIWDVEFVAGGTDHRRLANYLRAQAGMVDEAADELEKEAWDELGHDYEVEL